MTKIIFSISALLLAIFTIAGIYFSNITSTNRTEKIALRKLPANTAMVIEFNNEKTVYEIFENYELLQAIMGTEHWADLKYFKETFLDKELHQYLYNENLFLVPVRTKDSLQNLWLLPLRVDQKLNGEILGMGTAAIKNTERESYSLYIDSLGKTLYLNLAENVLAASFSKSLVDDYANGKNKKIAEEFVETINTGIAKNPNSPINVFFQNKNAIEFFDSFFRRSLKEELGMLLPWTGTSTFNMNFKSDALIFSGTSVTDTGKQTYLNIFTSQKPLKNTIDLIATESTSSYINFAISDRKAFDSRLKKLLLARKEYEQINTHVNSILKQAGGHIRDDLTQLLGNEFTLVKMANSENLGILKLSNGERAQFLLEPVSTTYSDKIRKLNVSNYLYLNYGDPFKRLERPFYAVVDNYFICGNNPTAVNQYLNEYTSGRFLFKTAKNIQFDQLVSDQSSITAFVHVANSKYLINTRARPFLKDLFKNDNFKLKDFYGISYQINYAAGQFISNFYAGYKISETDSLTTN